jgi:hypothetical protein
VARTDARRDLLQALSGWRHFVRRDADDTDLAIRMYCHGRSYELGLDATGELFRWWFDALPRPGFSERV